jgi:hypothetical protein
LKQLESAIIDLFSNLCPIYDIIIVSNADMTWINNCLTHFLEELKEYISDNDIKIYSAKNMFNKIVKNKNDWKIKCFKKVINDIYKDHLKYSDLTVISIGDNNEEKKAVFNLAKNNKFQKIKAKFIRMISYPSAATIILELKYLNKNLNNMILSSNTIFKMNIEFKNDKAEINCHSSKKIKNEDIFENNLINNSYIENNNYFYLNKNDNDNNENISLDNSFKEKENEKNNI